MLLECQWNAAFDTYPCQTTFYESWNVSSGTKSLVSFRPLHGKELNTNILRGALPPVLCPVRFQPSCDKSAAFLNESIIREIMIGMHLKPTVSRQARDHEPDAGLTQ